MLGLVKDNKIIPLTTDTGTGASVGTYIQQYKKKPISGYLYCDGSTFDENVYPALYMYLGTNVLPDYSGSVENGYVYIKATSGLMENQQDNVLNDVKDYIRRSNELSPIEDFTLTTTNQTIQYDGILFLRVKGNYNAVGEIYINDVRLIVLGIAGDDEDTVVLPVCKGDTFRMNRPDIIHTSLARWYKNR